MNSARRDGRARLTVQTVEREGIQQFGEMLFVGLGGEGRAPSG